MPHQRSASGPRLVPALLAALCTATFLPTLATATRSETINNSNYERKDLKEPSMRICLALLAGGGDFDAKLRLEVAPKSGSNVFNLVSSVNVTKELLQKVSGASQLRYEYTTADQKVGLKVTLNGEELPYKSYQELSSAQYKLNLVKFYIKGHVEVTYDCSEIVATTTTTLTPTPTTTTTTTPTTTPIPPTTTTTITPTTWLTKSQGRKNSIPTQPAAPFSFEEDQAGVSAAGGSMSTLHIVLVVVVPLVVVVVVVSVVLWRRKRRSTRTDQLHVAEVVPLHPPANVAAIQSTNTGIKSINNPVYRPTTTTNG